MTESTNMLFCESSYQERHPNDSKIVVNHFQSGGFASLNPPSGRCPWTLAWFQFFVILICFTHVYLTLSLLSSTSNPLALEFLRGRVIPVTSKLALQWLPCQAPRVIGSVVLELVEMESLVCNFNLSVAARKLVWANPFLRYTRMLLGR